MPDTLSNWQSDRAVLRAVMALLIGAFFFLAFLVASGAAGWIQPSCARAPAGVRVGVCSQPASLIETDTSNPYAIPPMKYAIEMDK